MKKIFKIIGVVFALIACSLVKGQNLPVGTSYLEDYYRRMQLLGKIDSTISFTVRPLSSQSIKVENVFDLDTVKKSGYSSPKSFSKGKVRLLPITLQTQYNTNRPYGWNDGPMVPARGFQSLFSAGVYAMYGPLSVQLRPEIVYAENRSFSGDKSYPSTPHIYIDYPNRFGEANYTKIFTGQSSIRLTYHALSLGLSSENLWWGPGIRNSIMMSNTSPGFKHLTFNTVKPVRTFLGSFEGQVVGGRLEGSGFRDKPDDWRYLSGLVISYQPRWIEGFYLGISRSIQAYNSDLSSFRDYTPFLQSLSSKNNEDPTPRDQLLSFFTRWVWKDAKAEVYFEYGRGDHSFNIRDFTLQPEHSRSYLFGLNKLIPLNRSNQYIQVNFEGTHLQQSLSYVIRTAGGFYTHGPIVHGYTHYGQVIGAGIGPGSNVNSVLVNWINGAKIVGLEYQLHTNRDDYFAIEKNKVINNSLKVNSQLSVKRLLLNFSMTGIHSSSENKGLNPFPTFLNKNPYNFQLSTNISYRL